ncbi:MAG: hypothetical protein H6724_06355 [Sandaracinus sp.]|nr:hypothetical protein [Sandaracinus sp.]
MRGALWIAVVLASSGCKVFDAGLIEPADATPSVDAPVADAPVPDVPRPSGLRKVPSRPSLESEGPDVDSMLLALRDVTLNQDADRWKDIGLDLDDLDSRPPVPEVECLPPNETAEPEVDGTDGIDNAFGSRLFPIVRLALEDLETDSRTNQAAGIGAILLRMTGWNGTRNDPRVSILLSQSAGGTTADPSSVRFEGMDLVNTSDAMPAPLPAWDGNDHWFARDDTFFMANEARPRVLDDNAYVSDGTVVMRLPDRIDILFFAGTEAGVRVRLTDAYAFGTFNEDFSGIEIATVAGRWAILDLLDTGNNIGICVGTPQRNIVEAQLDTIADVRSTPGTGGPTVTCDAISLGVTFRAVRAQWAGLGPSRDLPDPCTPP